MSKTEKPWDGKPPRREGCELWPPKVVICIPTLTRPYQQTVDALVASVPALEAAGWEHALAFEIGSPYISHARSKLARRAIDAGADVIVFIDHDVSWRPQDIVKLIETEGHVVAGTYRFKSDQEPYVDRYMCQLNTTSTGQPIARADGALDITLAPAGFLKVTRAAINFLMEKHPELVYGEACWPHLDLFNHGAYKGGWWGEDFAFCRRWRALKQKVWLVPDLSISHWGPDGKEYPGNFHEFLLRCPGGSNDKK